jgi:ribosomal-protein-alanine N-acetyltransferase
MLTLVPNAPLVLAMLGALLIDRNELFLVWPEAKFPFDREQWGERLLSRSGNRSYFLALDGRIVGHAALLETDEPQVRALSFVFITPDQRARGFGRELVALLEMEAVTVLGTRTLRLRARTYNPRAIQLYEKSGFVTLEQDGRLVIMRKVLAS